MAHQFVAVSSLSSIGPSDREQAGQAMLHRSMALTTKVFAKLLPYYFMHQLARDHIEEQTKYSQRYNLPTIPYPWLEEEQCVLDSESCIFDIEKSIQEQLCADGWLPERGRDDNLISFSLSKVDALILVHRYIPAFENWIQDEVENADDAGLIHEDVDQ